MGVFANFRMARRIVVTIVNSISFGFVARGLFVKGFGVAFLYGSRTFEEIGFCQKGNFGKVQPFSSQDKPNVSVE